MPNALFVLPDWSLTSFRRCVEIPHKSRKKFPLLRPNFKHFSSPEAIHQPVPFLGAHKFGLTARQMTYIVVINVLVFTSSKLHVENYPVHYGENEQQSFTHFKGQPCNSVHQYCKTCL
jgi:hypothetical protein